MQNLVIDDQLAGTLTANPGGLELFDSSNRRVGFFIPSADLKSEYMQAKSLWTDAEIEELSQQTGGITTEELLQRLSNL
jgi:phospholipid N-methyltransferase